VGGLSESLLWLFAEADNGGHAGAPPVWAQLWWIPAVALLFYWLLIRPQRQESARREATIRVLKPNDHVITSGGIYGVVTNVHREANAVTIRVDENTNTRLKVSLAAIARVLSEQAASETPPKKD
jgi:preprotein translocase subunit YajC